MADRLACVVFVLGVIAWASAAGGAGYTTSEPRSRFHVHGGEAVMGAGPHVPPCPELADMAELAAQTGFSAADLAAHDGLGRALVFDIETALPAIAHLPPNGVVGTADLDLVNGAIRFNGRPPGPVSKGGDCGGGK